MNADSGEVEDEFWVQTAGDEGRGGDDEPGVGGDGSDGNIPFNTQFFNDDFDDGFDPDGGITAAMGGMDGDMGVDPSEQDLLAATAGQTRRVKPEFVNYAKKAKRVDVRKLKENIWKGLDIIVVDDDEKDEHGMDVDEEDLEQSRRSKSSKPLTDPAEARQFSQVISGLTRSYPRDKLDEISTSFCFICLLHLANEQGLKLESDKAVVDVQGDTIKDSLRRGRSMAMQVEGEEEEVRDTIIPDDEDDLIAAGVGPSVKEDERAIGDIWDIKVRTFLDNLGLECLTTFPRFTAIRMQQGLRNHNFGHHSSLVSSVCFPPRVGFSIILFTSSLCHCFWLLPI
jgi:condensin complex subunit 2